MGENHKYVFNIGDNHIDSLKKIRLNKDEEKKSVISHLKKHCRKRLQSFKVPVKIRITNEKQHSDRFKKVRR